MRGLARQEGRFVRGMYIDDAAPRDRYPFDLPVIGRLAASGGMQWPAGVTFLVGENGSGKSTLIEGLATAVGLNAEGGSQNYRFATRPTESDLGKNMTVVWGPSKPRSRFFLRAESFYNLATASENLGGSQLELFGGVSPHQRSHGESFLDLMRNRFFPDGLYIMDEPESALSPRGCMAAVALLTELASARCQIIIATHSPILLSVPGATILEVDEEVKPVSYDEAMPVRLTREFLQSPVRFLRHLL